jgi:hypothetical protein
MRQFSHRPLHVVSQRGNERYKMIYPALDGLLVKHVSIVIDVNAYAVGTLDHVQKHVEV